MSARPKPVTDFNPQSQAPGPVKANPMAQGAIKGSTSGGSKPTHQAKPKGNGALHGSHPKNPQRLRG